MKPFDHLPQFNKDLSASLLVGVLIIQKVLFHIYIILRLWATYRRTSFTLTIKGVTIYGIIFFIEIACQSIYDFDELYGLHPYFEWAIWFYMAIDIILCCVVMGVFIYKLYGITLMKALNGDMNDSYGGAGSEWLDHGVMQRSNCK